MKKIIRLPRARGLGVALGVAGLTGAIMLTGPSLSADAARVSAKPQPTATVTVTRTVTNTVTNTVTATSTVTQTVTAPPQTVTSTTTVTQPPVTVTVTASPSTTSPTTTPTGTLPAGVTKRAVDGGANFYSKFTSPLNYTGTFPIGVWFEGVQTQSDVDMDKAAGLNTYVELTDNSNVSLLANSGMNIITDNLNTLGTKKNGHLLYDEADMQYGPGAGYDFMQQRADALPADGKIRYANYGKGVVFWESDAEARQFVNNYQDFTSTDVYWYTDPDACQASQGGYMITGQWRDLSLAECHRASNYGAQVSKVRNLANHDKPIWAYVELGAATSSGITITPAQAKAAVWSSLINGAQGVVYFNHSYSGSCQSQHILRDPCYANMRTAITGLNAQIKNLSSVLKSDDVEGLFAGSQGVNTLVKAYNGSVYVFASNVDASSKTVSFNGKSCLGSGTVTVIDENRTVPMSNGSFSDTFANAESYHLYKIDNAAACGL